MPARPPLNAPPGEPARPAATGIGAPLTLVVGMPRSGTTWVGKILDSHPDTYYLHEPDMWPALARVPLIASPEARNGDADVLRQFVAALPGHRSPRVVGRLPIFPKSYRTRTRSRIFQTAVMLAKAGSRALGEIPVLGSGIPERYRSRIQLVWKSVESLGRVGAIVRSADRCRAVVLVRHPCGQVASVLRGEAGGQFGGDGSTAEDYDLLGMLADTPQARRRGLTLEMLKSMQPAERLAWRWVLFHEKALGDIEGEPGCTWVRYEDLCLDPIGRARELVAFAGLDWPPQVEAFVSASTSRDSGGYYSIVKDPRRAAHGWRTALPADIRDRILGVLRESPLGALYD